MVSFFATYDVLSRSGLFDPSFYLTSLPTEVGVLDPLTHYIEIGAAERRNPSPGFDTEFYLEQCAVVGLRPEIPLLHYVQEGAALGLKTQRPPSPVNKIMLDQMIVKEGEDGRPGVHGTGWLIASAPVTEIAIEHDGQILGMVAYGLDRPDLKETYPNDIGDSEPGFAFTIDALPESPSGSVNLEFAARMQGGATLRLPFSVSLPSPPDPALRKWTRGGLESLGVPAMRMMIDECQVAPDGILTIVGWAVCLIPIAEVVVFANDARLGAAEFGLKRDDVAQTHSDYPNAPFSGIRFAMDTRQLGEGRCTIRVRCTAKGGLKREVSIPLQIVSPAKPLRTIEHTQARLECDHFGLTEDGHVFVDGWTFSAAGIESLTVLLDEIPLGAARLGIERPDVGNQFPERPEARFSGYRFEALVAGGGIEGEHVLGLRLRTGDGSTGDMRLPVLAVPVEKSQAATEESLIQVAIDSPNVVNGAATALVVSSLSINGWSLAVHGVSSIDISIDDQRVTSAYYGIRRDDVAAAFPDQKGALLSGFAAVIPSRALAPGNHKVGILVRDKEGNTASFDFMIEAGEIAEEPGPWTLRRKMAQAEIDLYERLLTATEWRPQFSLVMTAGSDDATLAAARLTLDSLAAQPYEDWRLAIVANSRIDAKRIGPKLLQGFDHIAERVTFVSAKPNTAPLDELAPPTASDGKRFVGLLFPGDEIGSDSFLEFAAWTAVNQEVDLVYCDERRINPATGQQDAFFKPDWSPDLLLSTNYIGRLWLATPGLLRTAGLTIEDLTARGEYELTLRLSECAAKIGHIPSLLLERGLAAGAGAPDIDRAALERALVRRGIEATVTDGCAPGLYQVSRAHAVKGLVSIVIPTRAAGGLVKICLDTIRNNTTYRNFEIVCIENIQEKDKAWRDWLFDNADKVVSTTEPFNWSRFNNLAAEQATGEYLIFLNDDIEIISPNWIDVLLSFAQRPEVGIVGPLLLYPDRSIQHAGVFLTRNGTARHAFRYGAQDDPGYFGLALTDRDVIGVTGACLMTRRDTFDEVGRFDESHSVINNDLDYCLRVWDAGYLNIYTAQTRLIHHELASRSEISDDYDSVNFDARWGETFLRGDPYFHPRLSMDFDDYVIDREPYRVVCPGHPLLSHDRIQRLLIMKLDHIGDAVTAIPAINRLRALFPEAHLSIMGGRSTKSVWSMLEGVDEIIDFDFFHARSGLGQAELTEADLLALRERLLPYRFDLAVDMRKSPDTRHVLKYTNARFLAGFGHRTDFPWLDIAVEWEGDPKFLSKHAHVSDDILRLVQAVELACNADRSVIDNPKVLADWPAFLPPDFGERRVVAVHPAAGTPTRQWPAPYFAQLIDLLIKDHDVNVAIIGGPDETDIADAILAKVRNTERVVSCLGKMKLQETTEFLPKCALFVGNNSGPSHLAAALGVPTVSVHSGVIASEEWAPYGPTGVAIRRDMTCAPCYIAKPDDCPRALACLGRLGAGEVLRVCTQLLNTGLQ